MKNVIIGLFMILVVLGLSAGQVDVDFTNPGDMDDFDLGGYTDVEWQSSGGINNSASIGFIDDFDNEVNRLVTYKNGYQITEVNEPIVMSAFIRSDMNGGWGGLGFSSLSSNSEIAQRCRIQESPAIGFSFYSSAAWIFSTDDDLYEEKVYNSYSPDIPLSWYKVVLTIIPRDLATGEVDATYQLFQAATDGTIGAIPTKTGTTNFINSDFIYYNSTIYPYFGEAWHRVPNIDNFSFTYPENVTLPVTLSSFTAITTSNNFANIQWTTASESNLIGYNIYRNELENMNTAIRINPTYIQATNSATGSQYSYTDEEVEMNTNYYYWLQSTEIDGFVEIYGPVSIRISGQSEDIEPVIPTSELKENYPNPFNPETTFEFFVKEGERGEFSIFNLKGQVIITKFFETGQHQYVWNGIDNSGRKVASGSYFYKLKTDSYQAVKKMILQK